MSTGDHAMQSNAKRTFPSHPISYSTTNRLVVQCILVRKGCTEPHQQGCTVWLHMVSGDHTGCEGQISN